MKKLLLFFFLGFGAFPAWAKPYEPNIETIEIPPPTVLPSTGSPENYPSRPINADEAARIALHYQGNITVAQGNIMVNEGITDQLRANWRPQVTVGVNYTDVLVAPSTAAILGGTAATGGSLTSATTGATAAAAATGGTNNLISSATGSGGSTVTGTTSSLTPSVSIRQLLFDFNHTLDLVRQSQELENAAAAAYTKAQLDTILLVKQAFYTYIQDIRLIKVQESNVADQREHLKQAISRYKAGLGLPSDVTQAQTAVADAVFNLQQARSNCDVARVLLVQQMGLDPRMPIPVDDKDEPDSPVDEPQKLFDEALIHRPEMKAAEATFRSNIYGVSAASSTSAPTVSLAFSYSGRLAEGTPQSNSVSLSLAINWTAYDGGLEAGKVKQAKGNLAISKAQLEVTAQQVISDVSQDYYTLKTAQQKLKTVLIEEASAVETVRLDEGRYKVGLGLLLQVLDDQAALLTAQTNHINAQTQISVARAALLRAIGRPLQS